MDDFSCISNFPSVQEYMQYINFEENRERILIKCLFCKDKTQLDIAKLTQFAHLMVFCAVYDKKNNNTRNMLFNIIWILLCKRFSNTKAVVMLCNILNKIEVTSDKVVDRLKETITAIKRFRQGIASAQILVDLNKEDKRCVIRFFSEQLIGVEYKWLNQSILPAVFINGELNSHPVGLLSLLLHNKKLRTKRLVLFEDSIYYSKTVEDPVLHTTIVCEHLCREYLDMFAISGLQFPVAKKPPQTMFTYEQCVEPVIVCGKLDVYCMTDDKIVCAKSGREFDLVKKKPVQDVKVCRNPEICFKNDEGHDYIIVNEANVFKLTTDIMEITKANVSCCKCLGNQIHYVDNQLITQIDLLQTYQETVCHLDNYGMMEQDCKKINHCIKLLRTGMK